MASPKDDDTKQPSPKSTTTVEQTTSDVTKEKSPIVNAPKEDMVKEKSPEKSFDLTSLKSVAGQDATPNQLVESAIHEIISANDPTSYMSISNKDESYNDNFINLLTTATNAAQAYLAITIPSANQDQVISGKETFVMPSDKEIPSGNEKFRIAIGEMVCKLADLVIAAKKNPDLINNPDSTGPRARDFEMGLNQLSTVYPESLGPVLSGLFIK